MDFKEKWMDRYKILTQSMTTSRSKTPDEFSHVLEEFTWEFLGAIGTPADFESLKQNKEEYQERFHLFKANQRRDAINPFRHYNQIASVNKNLRDNRKQEESADVSEKVRFMLFRIATAIGIAVVVLGTYYVGHKLGIPLPLRPII